MTLDGTWTIGFHTPGGDRQADLVLASAGAELTGTFDGNPIRGAHTDGTKITFTAQLITPFKVKITCTATVDGDTISGKAKAAIMTIPFTGTRQSTGPETTNPATPGAAE